MKKILLIPGDGIGIEVMEQAKRVLLKIVQKFKIDLSCEEVDWGAERYLKDGVGLPQGALESIPNKYQAILFGALGDKRIPDMAHGREILLGLRFGLDLYINIRPVRNTKGIDIVIFRENTQDIYLGLGRSINKDSNEEVTLDISKHTYHGIKRIVEAAFTYAASNNRKKVTLVDKSNAIKFGGRLWQRVFSEVSSKYSHITAEHCFVDAAALYMVRDPQKFDVIVTSNLFGDILSDLGAGLCGGLGLASSANINPNTIGLFEPVHGSAPDIAGKNLANPVAMFLSLAMLMKHIGYEYIANILEKGVEHLMADDIVTKDIGGTFKCNEVGDHYIDFLENYKEDEMKFP